MTKRDIEYNVPLRLPIPGEDTEAMFRRLVAFSYAVGRQYRADGGPAEEPGAEASRFVREELARPSEAEQAQIREITRPSPLLDQYSGYGAREAVQQNVSRPMPTAHEFVQHQLKGNEPQLPQMDREAYQRMKEYSVLPLELAAYEIPVAGQALAAVDLARSIGDLGSALRTGDKADVAGSAAEAGMAASGARGKLAKMAAAAMAGLMPEEAEAGTVGKALRAIREHSGSPEANLRKFIFSQPKGLFDVTEHEAASRVNDPAIIALLERRGWRRPNSLMLREDNTLTKAGQKKLADVISSENNRIISGETARQQKRFLKSIAGEYAGDIGQIHKRENLDFAALPVSDYNSSSGIILHKSPIYNQGQSSEYKLMLIGDDPAYARKSNHWGRFATNIKEGSPEARAAGLTETDDPFGRAGLKHHNWNLSGGNIDSRSSQAGFLLLKDLLGWYARGGEVGGYADGGVAEIEDAIRTARSVGDQRAMSHMEGGPGVIEKQDVKIREPLSGYEMTVGRFPKQTAPAIEGALQTASEVAPYFTPAAPIAAARDVAVGLREGNMDDLAMSAFGIPGKLGRLAKSAAVSAYALAPEEAEAGTVGKALRAIRAYHGSPYAFDRFDISKIGTGEGAQAYGHGLYFSDNENVARSYREGLSGMDSKIVPRDAWGDMAKIWDAAQKHYKDKPEDQNALVLLANAFYNGADANRAIEFSLPHAKRFETTPEAIARVANEVYNPGAMYETLLHVDPEHLLDWDAYLSDQSPILKKAIRGIAETSPLRDNINAIVRKDREAILRGQGPISGKNIYENLGGYSRPQETSEALREAGIPGIKYLDAGSRATGEGSRNYVIFDDKLIDILRRYAQGGEVDREDFDRGGSIIKAAIKKIMDYKDPASKYIKEWNWRPLAEVQKDIGTSEVPEHVQNFGRYMGEMSSKAATEGLDPEDVIKAYMITRSSIQREGRTPQKIASYGIPVRAGAEDLIRPEGHMADFLSSPMGVRFLNEARKGNISQDTVDAAVSTMRPFGLSKVEPDAMDWARRNLPERASEVSDLVARAKEGASTPDEWRDFTRAVRGVGPAKTGFLGSLLGRGDLPTLDARQAILHTGMKNAEAQDIMARNAGRAGHEAVDRLAARQRALDFQLPEDLDPFYQHLAHHTVWDAIGKEKTTHQDIIDAMKPRADGGEVDGYADGYADGGSVIKDALDVVYGLPRAAEAETSA